MSIEKMSKQQEVEFVDAVTHAIKLANDGMAPNVALAKVASDEGWNKHFIKRAVEAFNTSKAIKHRKTAQGEAKAASFEIADPEVIIKTLYPDNVQAPAEVKQAEWAPTGMDMEETRIFDLEHAPTLSHDSTKGYQKDIEMLMKRACDEQHRQEVVVADLRQKAASARLKMINGIQKLSAYFRLNTHEPFDRVESALLQFDKSAKCVMDTVWDMSKRASFKVDKRASGPAKVQYKDKTPYTLVGEILESKEAYARAIVKCAAADQELKTYKVELRERMEKIAVGGGTLAPFMLGMVLPKGSTEALKSMTTTGPTSPEDITSVQFDAERKGIQTQMMLHDFMKHDEVLSKADPRKLVQAYNDIASVAPRAADSPLIMRGLLRKSVETASYDPYESANLVSIETGLKKKDAPMGAKID